MLVSFLLLAIILVPIIAFIFFIGAAGKNGTTIDRYYK